MQIVPPVPSAKSADLQGYHGISGDGGNRTRATVPPSRAYLIHGGGLLELEQVPPNWPQLPRVKFKRWVEEATPARPRPTGASNRGKKFPATPVYGEDADAILNALYDPTVHGEGKWAKKWGPIRHRNRTAMAVARGTALRVHELLLLRLSDIDSKNHQVVVRRGKGGKRGLIAILPAALAELETWLPVWRDLGFGGEDLLFPVLEGPTKGGQLSQSYLRVKLHQAAAEAGVSVRPVPHQWRHGLAVELHRRKVPIGIIQRQLRHATPAVTGVYLAGISADEVIESVLGAFE